LDQHRVSSTPNGPGARRRRNCACSRLLMAVRWSGDHHAYCIVSSAPQNKDLADALPPDLQSMVLSNGARWHGHRARCKVRQLRTLQEQPRELATGHITPIKKRGNNHVSP
jgi:hypothetical protein